jgi:hypothetical protein
MYGLGCNLHHRLAQELEQAVFERLLAWVAGPNGNEALDQWLQVSRFRSPDVSCFSFHLVHWIVRTKAAVSKGTVSDANRVEEGGGSRRCKGSFAHGRTDGRHIREAVAPETDHVLCVAVDRAHKVILVRI